MVAEYKRFLLGFEALLFLLCGFEYVVERLASCCVRSVHQIVCQCREGVIVCAVFAPDRKLNQANIKSVRHSGSEGCGYCLCEVGRFDRMGIDVFSSCEVELVALCGRFKGHFFGNLFSVILVPALTSVKETVLLI